MTTESIEFTQAKTNRFIKTVFTEEIKEAVFDYINNGRQESSEPYIFLNKGRFGATSSAVIKKLVRRAFVKSGVDFKGRKIGARSLRASLATALLSEGKKKFSGL